MLQFISFDKFATTLGAFGPRRIDKCLVWRLVAKELLTVWQSVARLYHLDALGDPLVVAIHQLGALLLAHARPLVLLDRYLVRSGVELWNLAVNLEEDGNTGDVVDYRIVLSPLFGSGSNYGVACLLRAVVFEEGPDNLADLFVGEEFPDAIAGNHDELVLGAEFESHDFGIGADADHVGKHIAYRPAHRQSRRLLILQPHPLGAKTLSPWSADGFNPSAHFLNSFLLNGHIRLVIDADWRDVHAALLLAKRVKHGARIASVRAKHCIAIEEHAAASGTAEMGVVLENLVVGQLLMEQIVAIV